MREKHELFLLSSRSHTFLFASHSHALFSASAPMWLLPTCGSDCDAGLLSLTFLGKRPERERERCGTYAEVAKHAQNKLASAQPLVALLCYIGVKALN